MVKKYGCKANNIDGGVHITSRGCKQNLSENDFV